MKAKRAVVENNVARYWAPKVSQQAIRRLYETDAKGIVDEDLINDVGYALFVRCDTIRIVTEKRCPECDEEMPFAGKTSGSARNEAVSCPQCGWTTTWAHYHRSYKGKRIHGGRAYPAFLQFTTEFKRKLSPRQKLMAIDRLVHSIHEAMVHARAATPGSVNLIEGTEDDILALLNDLAYGDTTESSQAMREDFKNKMKEGQLVKEEHQRIIDARKARRSSQQPAAGKSANKGAAQRRGKPRG